MGLLKKQKKLKSVMQKRKLKVKLFLLKKNLQEELLENLNQNHLDQEVEDFVVQQKKHHQKEEVFLLHILAKVFFQNVKIICKCLFSIIIVFGLFWLYFVDMMFLLELPSDLILMIKMAVSDPQIIIIISICFNIFLINFTFHHRFLSLLTRNN